MTTFETSPRTHILPDGSTVTLPALTTAERAAAELHRPWTLEEATRGVLWCRRPGNVIGAAIEDAALRRLHMALVSDDAARPFE